MGALVALWVDDDLLARYALLGARMQRSRSYFLHQALRYAISQLEHYQDDTTLKSTYTHGGVAGRECLFDQLAHSLGA